MCEVSQPLDVGLKFLTWINVPICKNAIRSTWARLFRGAIPRPAARRWKPKLHCPVSTPDGLPSKKTAR